MAKARGSAAAVVAALLLAAFFTGSCGRAGSGSSPEGEGRVVVGSKNFTEQVILGELYAQALAAEGFEVEKRLDLGSEQVADEALSSGEIDLYPEYTGTALQAILGYGGPSPRTPEETYRVARRLYAEREPKAAMLKPARFQNGNAIVVRREVAEERDLRTIGDLAEASPELTFVAFSEFLDRQDSYPNMREHYPALRFREIFVVKDIELRYARLTEGEADAGVGFTTDPQLASDELVVLEDEKDIWPFYQPAPVVRAEALEESPGIARVLDPVSDALDEGDMRGLNGAVDLEGEPPEEVARRFLAEEGLLD